MAGHGELKMLNWFNDLISSESTKSSARFLNIFGGIMFGAVYIADYAVNRVFNVEATEVLALYYASVYGASGVISWAKGKLEVNRTGESNV